MNDRLSNLKRCWWVDLIGLVCVVALSFGTWHMSIRPMLESRARREAAQVRYNEQKREATDMKSRIAQVQKGLHEAEIDLKENRIQLRPSSQVNQHVADVTRLAESTGLQVDGIVPEAASRGSRFASVTIRLNGHGAYPQCAAFMHKLGGSFPDTGIRAFDLSVDPRDVRNPVAFTLELAWHTVPQGEASAGDTLAAQ